jgi:hypothetical protein
VRSTYHNLPFKRFPKIMTKSLVENSTDLLNIFPAKGGISPYFSPYALITHMAVDYDKELAIPFGAYVQGSNEPNPSNTNLPRTLDCIYLGPIKNKQGGHKLMDITSGRMITRPRVKELPMTELIINAVDKLGAKDGARTLKFSARDGTPLEPADWIAGVEGADNENNDDQGNDNDADSVDNRSNGDNSAIDIIEINDPDPVEDNDDEGDDDPDDSDDDSDNGDDDDEPPALIAREYDTSDSEDESEDEESVLDREEIDDLSTEPRRYNPNIRLEIDDDEDDSDDEDSDGDDNDEIGLRRSTRERREPQRYDPSTGTLQIEDLQVCHNIITLDNADGSGVVGYDDIIAGVAARFIHFQNEKAMKHGASLGQQYIVNKGLKLFGDRGKQAASKELQQLHDRECFSPILVSELTPSEKKKAQEGIMFLTEKRDGTCKARAVYNGKPTREWLDKDDSASPTASLESIFLTAIIDAKENRDVMSCDIPNAFIQAHMPEITDDSERVIMKLSGILLDLLVELAPELYGPYVVEDNGKRVLYLQVLRALYGMLVAALLWYRKFRKDLEDIGFVFNPYDPCVANRWIKKKQQTVKFHVDDLMSSHVSTQVNDDFLKWLNDKYGSHGAVTSTRGKIHDYLGMVFDFSQVGKVVISMVDYMTKMIDEFPYDIDKIASTPATDDLFGEGSGPVLDKDMAKVFHTWVANSLFACKRARPESSNQDDWKKLMRLLEYIKGSLKDVLVLKADDLHVIKWYVDASFAVHADFKSHTGAAMTYGSGAPITMSRKQKLNTRSSTEAELVGADDAINLILWTRLFLGEQGYDVTENIVFQDNKSAILLEKNGKRSSSKRTRALNIRYFFITDQVEKGTLKVEYCPTGDMVGDFFTKPLQGEVFRKFKAAIMGA